MKKQVLFFFAVISVFYSHGQSLSPFVIASAGSYSLVGGYSLSSTVGELAAVQTFTAANDSLILTQGFQQPNDIINGLLDIEKGANGSFSVYPVPARTNISYGYQFNESGTVEVSLFNIIGQKLDYSLIEDYTTGKLIHNFDCSSYASGNYILRVRFTTSSSQEVILSRKVQIITN